jgi:hypothetical protein
MAKRTRGKNIPTDKVDEIVRLRKRGLSTREIGKEVGTDAGTVSRVVEKYMPNGGAKGGPPPDDMEVGKIYDRLDVDGSVEILTADHVMSEEEMIRLCKLDPKKWIPQFYRGNVWQNFYRNKERTGHRKVALCQSRIVCKRVITEQLEEAIHAFIKEFGPKPLPKPKIGRRKRKTKKGQMVSWGMWDAHVGSYAWNRECPDSWDVDTACNRVCHSVDEMVEELQDYPVQKILMPIGNDFMHFDSVRLTTAFGDHFLDTDTRYARVYQAALICLSYQVERALEICDDVELLYVPGNHDTTSSFTLTVALAQRYRNDPRISADLAMNPRKYRLWGGVLLGFDHGRDATPDRLAQALAEEAIEYWSRSTYREIQVGDKHRKWEKRYEATIPTNGVTIYRHPALCNTDAWHHRHAFVGEPMKSVEARRYDHVGLRGTHVTWARDDDHARVKGALKRIT